MATHELQCSLHLLGNCLIRILIAGMPASLARVNVANLFFLPSTSCGLAISVSEFGKKTWSDEEKASHLCERNATYRDTFS